MRRIIVAATLFIAIMAPARADFQEGNAAYERGDYAAALREWRPLARQGDANAQAGAVHATEFVMGVGMAPLGSKQPSAPLYRRPPLHMHCSAAWVAHRPVARNSKLLRQGAKGGLAMLKRILAGAVLSLMLTGAAAAGPFEEGVAAYQRGDY